MNRPEHNPFAQLGIAPTLDVAVIKRAYFSRVARCPPHSRGEAFRTLRAAYEVLASQEQRVLAYLHALPGEAERSAFEALCGERIAAARARTDAAADRRTRIARFVETLSHMPLSKALECGEDPPRGPRRAG